MNDQPKEEWSLPRRFAFRLMVAYVIAAEAPFPFTSVPGFRWVGVLWSKISGPLVPWFGQQLFGTPVAYAATGSSDRLWNWAGVVHDLTFALLFAIVWSLLDRSRKQYERLAALFIIYVRYALSTLLLFYAYQKIFKLQFPMPGPERVLQPVGEMSPMQLMWTFIGLSPLYTVFGGAGEFVAAVLLLHRRSATLGALISVGVMANVVVLNLSYDVCVKQFAIHLLFFSLIIVGFDARRLLAMFVLNRPVEPAHPGPRFANRWLHLASRVAKWLFLAWINFGMVRQALRDRAEYGDDAPTSAVFGLYRVTEFRRNGVLFPAKFEDDAQWRFVGVGRDFITVRRIDDSLLYFYIEHDAPTQRLMLQPRGDLISQNIATYRIVDATHATLTLLYAGEYLQMTLERRDHTQLLLLSRGFHWVNEAPFMR